MRYDFQVGFTPSTFVNKTRQTGTCTRRSHLSSTIHSVPYTFQGVSKNNVLHNSPGAIGYKFILEPKYIQYNRDKQ